MKTFHVRYVWEINGNTGFSSYTLFARDSLDATKRAKRAANRDFPHYTLRDFSAEEI